jgi:hypothetical protein
MRWILGDFLKLPTPNQILALKMEQPAYLALHDFSFLLQVGFNHFQFSAAVVA